jgi:hypothetical protein
MLARLKSSPSTDTLTEFEAIAAKRDQAQAEWQAAEAKQAGYKAAMLWHRASDAEREGERFDHVRKTIAKVFGGNPPAERRIPKLAEEVNEQLEELRPKWIKAQQEWQEACRRETSRIAISLQPQHRAAVKRLAAAVEELSRAIEQERAVHPELRKKAPLETSAYLPNCAPPIGGGLDNPVSPLSEWARRLRKIGLLD